MLDVNESCEVWIAAPKDKSKNKKTTGKSNFLRIYKKINNRVLKITIKRSIHRFV